MLAESSHGECGLAARQLDASAVHSSVLYTTTELPNKLLKSRAGQVKHARTFLGIPISLLLPV